MSTTAAAAAEAKEIAQREKDMFLKGINLLGDPEVVDCDPQARTVTFVDGRTRQVTEVWTRVMGYHRPVSQFNIGKKQEHAERLHFSETCGCKSAGALHSSTTDGAKTSTDATVGE